MPNSLQNTTFSNAVHRASDIIKNFRTIFETSHTRMLDVNTEGEKLLDRSTRNGSGEKNPAAQRASQLDCH